MKYKPEKNSPETIRGMCDLSCCIHFDLPSLAVDLQCKTWRSKVYLHFIMPPAITTMDSGEIGYRFTCKRYIIFSSHVMLHADDNLFHAHLPTSDPSRHIKHNRIDESTSNLAWHVNSCDPSAASSPAVSTFDVGRFRYLVAAWSARCARPHAIIEDEELCEIFVMLYSAVDVHSHQTVARDISDMYERSRIVIALHLQSHSMEVGIHHGILLADYAWGNPYGITDIP